MINEMTGELIQASMVLSPDEQFDDFVEVARVPAWPPSPQLGQHFIVFFDDAGAQRSNL